MITEELPPQSIAEGPSRGGQHEPPATPRPDSRPAGVAGRLFSAALFDVAATRTANLTDLELRLVRLASELVPNFSVLLRAAATPPDSDGLAPLTPEILAQATKAAFLAAVEIEQPLREIRDQLLR